MVVTGAQPGQAERTRCCVGLMQRGARQMKSLGLGRYALSSCVAAALLAGCGALPLSLSKGQDDTQPPIGAPGAMPQTAARATSTNRTRYKVLYSFGVLPDGSEP